MRALNLILGLLLVASAILAIPNSLLAQRSSYRLWLQEAVLDGRALIVVGRIDKSRRLPNGETVDRIGVARVLRGPKSDSVSVIGGTARFRERAGDDQILFLDRGKGGSLYRFVDAVAAEGEEGRHRIQAMQEILKAAAKPLAQMRMKEALSFINAGVSSPSAWVRRIVVREADRLSRRAPDLFDLAAIGGLRRLVAADLPQEERQLLRRARQRIERYAAIDWTRSPRVFADPAKRDSFLRDLEAFQKSTDVASRREFLDRAAKRFGAVMTPLLVKLLRDREAQIRDHAVFLLGELEAAAGADDLIAIVRQDADPKLRDRALAALEKIAPLDALPELLRLAFSEATREGAWRALAAINSGEARLFLKDTLLALEKDADADAEMLGRLRHLLSSEFRKEVAQAREARRKRWRRD
jgi:hypothetical protein